MNMRSKKANKQNLRNCLWWDIMRTAVKYLPIKEAFRVWKFLKSYQRWQKVILFACSYFRIWHSVHSWKEKAQRSDDCGNTFQATYSHPYSTYSTFQDLELLLLWFSIKIQRFVIITESLFSTFQATPPDFLTSLTPGIRFLPSPDNLFSQTITMGESSNQGMW
jgi:hypothetical protein